MSNKFFVDGIKGAIGDEIDLKGLRVSEDEAGNPLNFLVHIKTYDIVKFEMLHNALIDRRDVNIQTGKMSFDAYVFGAKKAEFLGAMHTITLMNTGPITIHEEEEDEQKYWEGLVEWESGGLSDVSTDNLKEYKQDIERELERRERA